MSDGMPTQNPEKMKTKKNTSVTFSKEIPGARKARNREKWEGVYVGGPDETEFGESGELDEQDASLSDAV